jgi:regulation of enolase protein 1 (concanavalin A-like superfamily)
MLSLVSPGQTNPTMKLKPIKNLIALLALSAGSCLHAGVFSDNFSSAHDYLNNGVAGTHWTGMSLGAVNPSTVSQWNASVTATNTLTITNAGGSWVDGGDGPYLWTMVRGSGDFTNTVHVLGLSTVNYNFAGLLVRSPDTSNGANWLYVSMFPEYSVGVDIRDTTNGVSQESTYAPSGYSDADTNTWPTWLQITRVAGVLTCYASVDGVTWAQAYASPRTDLTNDLQVGVYNSTYSANVCWAQYQNFTLSGPDVATNVTPNAAVGVSVTPAVNSLNIVWTNGAGTDGSVVVVRKGYPIIRQPVDGTNYTGSAVFGAGTDLGESNYVAYVGSGTNITLTNLIPTIPYTIAVYGYTGSGAATLYAIGSAPVATAAALGLPTGISISYGTTNAVATDDTIQPTITLYFTGGGSTTVTANSTITAGNTNLAAVGAGGLITGLAPGTVAMTAAYQTFTTTSNLTVVKLPVTDDFSTPWNFLTQGLPGTGWQGLLLDTNDLVLGETATGPTVTLLANAGITKAGRLTLSSHDSGFDAAADTGTFLYRTVSGDFSISVQLASFNDLAYHMPGLMARAPFELAYTENYIQWVGFNEFGIGNFSRVMLNGSKTEANQQATPAMPFLMLQRQTNTFSFYQKAHALDSWIFVASVDRPDLDGVSMQVGLVDQTFTGNTGTAEFANLLLTIPNAVTNNTPAGPTNLVLNSSSGLVSASWTPSSGSSGSVVIVHTPSGVTRQPGDGADYSAAAIADFILSTNLGGSNIVVYAGTGSSVTVTNLPLAPNYFAVYSYKTVSGTNYYNLIHPATASINLGAAPVVTIGATNIVGSGLQLTWSQGTLLEATNILGPWVTNTATSPYVAPVNTTGNKFFKIQVQ